MTQPTNPANPSQATAAVRAAILAEVTSHSESLISLSHRIHANP